MVSLLVSTLALGAAATPLSRREVPSGVPSYVIDYAPILYLHSQDPYFPSDISAQVANTQPEVNYTVVNGAPNPLTLDNLDSLNNLGGKDIYLTSKQNIVTNPAYLYGEKPDASGKTGDAVSAAIIVNDHGAGDVDAFYMYFYAFNYGGSYFGDAVGDHVGDWEHSMVRFVNGKPTAVWLSQHANGEAFTYDTLNKYNGGVRPAVYSANGSHATYAISGTHDHSIPNFNLPAGPVQDYCDNGPIWDPTLSAYYYTYDAATKKFAAYDSSTPVNYLNFLGKWGDQAYPKSDPRYSCPLGIDLLCKYVSGPTGPQDKQLNRTKVCPDNGNECILRPFLTARDLDS